MFHFLTRLFATATPASRQTIGDHRASHPQPPPSPTAAATRQGGRHPIAALRFFSRPD